MDSAGEAGGRMGEFAGVGKDRDFRGLGEGQEKKRPLCAEKDSTELENYDAER